MFDEVAKGKGKGTVVDFDKMKGRSLYEDDGGDSDIEKEFGPQEKVLDLDVKDWQPNKAKEAKVIPFQDPKKYPRFNPKDEKKPKPLDAPPSPEPKYNLIDGKEINLVNMNAMRGREDAKMEAKDIEDEVYGNIDPLTAIKLAEERAQAIEKGKELMLKRPVFPLEFNKQIGRNDGDNAKEIIDKEIGEDGQLYHTSIEDNKYLSKPTFNTKGALDWDKIPGRPDPEKEKKLIGDEYLIHDEELDLNPKNDQSSK